MKKLQQITGFRDIKNIHTVGVTCVPKKQRSAYLELYVLKREKDRLEKEIFVMEKRKGTAERQLYIIKKRVETLQKEMLIDPEMKTPRSSREKVFRTMPITY